MMSEKAREARNAYLREWRAKNREHCREYLRNYRAINHDRIQENIDRHWERKADSDIDLLKKSIQEENA